MSDKQISPEEEHRRLTKAIAVSMAQGLAGAVLHRGSVAPAELDWFAAAAHGLATRVLAQLGPMPDPPRKARGGYVGSAIATARSAAVEEDDPEDMDFAK